MVNTQRRSGIGDTQIQSRQWLWIFAQQWNEDQTEVDAIHVVFFVQFYVFKEVCAGESGGIWAIQIELPNFYT